MDGARDSLLRSVRFFYRVARLKGFGVDDYGNSLTLYFYSGSPCWMQFSVSISSYGGIDGILEVIFDYRVEV